MVALNELVSCWLSVDFKLYELTATAGLTRAKVLVNPLSTGIRRGCFRWWRGLTAIVVTLLLLSLGGNGIGLWSASDEEASSPSERDDGHSD